MKLLKRLYETYSPSGKEMRMRNFIKKHVADIVPEAIVTEDNIGNIYITRGLAAIIRVLSPISIRCRNCAAKIFEP